MHVNAKKITFLGVLLAICVILIILSSIIETNSLFLIAGASFCIGIAIREYKLLAGISFFAASIILGYFLAPNKIYLITYTFMALYLLLSEAAWLILEKKYTNNESIIRVFWIIRYVIFNAIYIPIILLAPALIITQDITTKMLFVALFAGQILLFLFEKGYCYFQAQIWDRIRKNINK